MESSRADIELSPLAKEVIALRARLAEAAATIERLTKERDEHLRLKNELVLKAYPAMDERDRLSTELAKAREALEALEDAYRAVEIAMPPEQGKAAVLAWMKARAALAPAKTAAPTHRHIKSGHLVRVIGTATAQVSRVPIGEMSTVVVYEHDGQMWVRHTTEFHDGRFAPAKPCPICHGSGYDERTRITLHMQRCPNGCHAAPEGK